MLGPWVWSLLNNTTGAWHMSVTFLLGHCLEFVKVTLQVLETSELVFVLDLPWHDLRSWLHIQSQLLNYLLRVSFKSPVKFLLRVCEDHIRGTWHSATSPLHCVLYALVSGESACAQLCSTVKKKVLTCPLFLVDIFLCILHWKLFILLPEYYLSAVVLQPLKPDCFRKIQNIWFFSVHNYCVCLCLVCLCCDNCWMCDLS